MALIIAYGACLLLSVLVSGVAARTVLSTSLIFLVAGALIGQGGLNLIHLNADSPVVGSLADLALFVVLFVDGTALRNLAGEGTWKQPAVALAVGMPLSFIGVAVLCHWLIGMSWVSAMLVGAILAPTDPVFASAIVGRTDVPARLRRLLSIESGLNDGLALPVVVILISVAGGDHTSLVPIVGELVSGLALGVALPAAIHLLLKIPLLGAEPRLQPLGPVAVGILIYGIAHVTDANAYLAAFAGGITVARLNPAAEEAFSALGDQLAELAKFAALLVFGALLTPQLLTSVGVGGWAIAVLSLILVRPLSVLASLWRSNLPRRELYAAAWFGPKGFASVVYALLVLHAGVPDGLQIYELVAVCIALSIAAHSTTDVPVARLFDVDEMVDVPDDRGPG